MLNAFYTHQKQNVSETRSSCQRRLQVPSFVAPVCPATTIRVAWPVPREHMGQVQGNNHWRTPSDRQSSDLV